MKLQSEPATATLPPVAPGDKSPAQPPVPDHTGHHGQDAPASLPAKAGAAPKPLNHGPMDHSKMAGHDHGAMIADFLRRFWVCLALSVPLVAGSTMFQHLVGYHFTFPYSTPVLLALATAIFGYGGWPFLSGTVAEMRSRQPGMMTLVAVGITVAYGYSVAVSVGWLRGMDLFMELSTLIDIMLLGHYLEMKSVAGASHALELLVQLLPAEAHQKQGDKISDVKVSALVVGDLVLVRPGERIPTDGEVTDGSSAVNESMLTGESVPIQKEAGGKVIAGAVNGEGALTIKVTHQGADSYLNKVVKMVGEAQQTKSQTQTLADRAAGWLTAVSLVGGLGTLVVWLWLGKGAAFAIQRMVTVMVTACPHALGVAIPLVVAISTSISARKGLLIRNRTAFEEARKITAMVFDKTGTLTEGAFGVTRVKVLAAGLDEAALLSMVAALEQQSQHPIAQGIVREAHKRTLTLPAVQNFKSLPGQGVSATVAGKVLMVASPGYLKTKNIALPPDATSNGAETVVFVLLDNQLAGYVALADRIRDDSKEAVQRLKAQGIKVYMATGDNQQVADAVAKELDLDGVYAEVLPDQKVKIVKDLQAQGQFVAMTGDGVNDAPALAQANVGIAVGSGTDIAAETADIILVNSKPTDITNLVEFGKATYAKMQQNLWWATGYNVIALPLAAGVLYPHFVLSPAMGAVLMSASTVIVALNAQLLRRSLK